VKYSIAFFARSATVTPTGMWLADAFLSYWGPGPLPAVQQTTLVWAVELEPSEVGHHLSFDVTMRSPDGSQTNVGHVETPTGWQPGQPQNTPYFVETLYLPLTLTFQQPGLHWFDIVSADGMVYQLRFWVEGLK
jgi:hypothetical protein